MAARSPDKFNRVTLTIGIVMVTLAGAVAAFGFAKLEHHPDLGKLVYAGDGAIYAHDLATGNDTKIVSIPKDTSVAEPSPDGRFIAYANADGALWMYDVAGHRRYQVAEQATIPIGWSPDSKLVARELVGNGDVVLIDPNAGRRGLIRGNPLTQSLPVWITSSRFAIGDLSNANNSMLVDTQTSEEPVVNASFGVPLAASPDGAQLLAERDHELREMKVTPSGVTASHVLFRGDATVAATSSQGFVAFAAKDRSGTEGIWVLETGSGALKRIVRGKVDWLVFTRDGSAICYAKDGAIYALTLADNRTKRVSRRGIKVLTVLSFRVVPSK